MKDMLELKGGEVSIPEKREIPFEAMGWGSWNNDDAAFQSLRKGKYPSKTNDTTNTPKFDVRFNP